MCNDEAQCLHVAGFCLFGSIYVHGPDVVPMDLAGCQKRPKHQGPSGTNRLFDPFKECCPITFACLFQLFFEMCPFPEISRYFDVFQNIKGPSTK